MRAHVDLATIWQRYDWRESLFAPGLKIVQALLPDGSTASGAGRRRETALDRCLGETAEWRALGRAGAALRPGFSPWRDGVAAHPDAGTARTAAVLEAYERFAVIGWWQRRLPARPVAADWLAHFGILDRLSAARIGAAQRRLTGLWMIPAQGAPFVAVCRSSSSGGQQPVLGYGCDTSARRATEKALREMLLMEMNLMELLAAGPSVTAGRLATIRDRIGIFARRCPSLLPQTPAIVPGPDAGPASPLAAKDWFGARVDLRDITPPGDPLPVWLCRPMISDPVLMESDGSPFV